MRTDESKSTLLDCVSSLHRRVNESATDGKVTFALLSGLTQADHEANDQTKNGSNGVDSETEVKESIIKEEEFLQEEAPKVAAPQPMLTPFELEGLWNLLGKLEELPDQKKCVPVGIMDAAALIRDMRVGA